ncbi:MAG: aminotransferase class V-fold PLP-dependent enzyme [Gemmatimonadales bacterium]
MNAPFDVAALRREEFPWADEVIYLNHAGIGPLPERARRAVNDFTDRRAAAHRLTEDELMAILGRARSLAARLIGARAEDIALTTNTSWGVILGAMGLPLGEGDVVLASQGEFPANVFPWRAQRRRGVTLELLPVTRLGYPDEERMVARMADPAVKVLAVSSVQFGNGFAADLERLSRVARETDTFLAVDAIQSLGQLPLDVSKTPVDVLAAGGQKWLLSPWGAGFAYVRPGLRDLVDAPFGGWMAFEGTDDLTRLTDYPEAPRADARRYEVATLPFQDLLGMGEALSLLLELGIDAIAAHLATIEAPVLEWAQRRGVPLKSPVGPRGSAFLCLTPPEGRAVFEQLRGAGVVASYREGAIRLSPHCYNTIDEMVRVTALLDRAIP